MKRIYCIGLLCMFFACGVHAQNIRIEYAGDPLSSKERSQIEEFLRHEVLFYSQFGLPDTLSLKLIVFEQRKKGMAYLDSIGISAKVPLLNVRGLYNSKRREAILIGREQGKKKSLSIIYHELSHHLTLQITGNHPPTWLMEGLAEYFEHCEIKKGRLKHELTSYELGRVRTMYMLDEIDLKTFVDSQNNRFMQKQRTEESYAYILAHALVSFWIEDVPDDLFKKFIENLRNGKGKLSVYTQIDRLYPGGFERFEQDFSERFKGD